MFLPFSFAFYVISGRKTPTLTIIIIILVSTTVVETAQYIFNIGVFDVDDIMLNFIGGTAGLFLFNLWHKN